MTRMRQFMVFAAVFCLALISMGMGSSGESVVVETIPKPDRPFTVEVLDAEDMTFTVSEFSVDGLTVVPVTIGRASVSIDFVNVKAVRFMQTPDSLMARISFRDGSTKDASVDPEVLFYGRTKWGLMRLAAQDVRLVTFIPED